MTDIASIPAAWLAHLPRYRDRPEAVDVPVEHVDAREAQERIVAAARGRQGEAWAAIRRAMRGERMFRIEGGGGGDDLPLVVGVDVFLSQSVIYTLASVPEVRTLAPVAVAEAFAASLSTLREDAGAGGSKWYPPHFAKKFEIAAAKAHGAQSAADAFAAKLGEAVETAAAAASATARARVVQIDDRFWVLDDRTAERPRYEGPMGAGALRALARQIWPRDVYPVDVPTEKGPRPMKPAEIVDAYGSICTRLRYEYAAVLPRVDDLDLVLTPALRPAVPVRDLDVEAWLGLLDPSGLAERFVWASALHRCDATVPALALVGAAHVGKSLFADALARSIGMPAATPLDRALGQFRAALAGGPVLFADEGMPRDRATGVPRTEEFRALVTGTDHLVERKGSDAPMYIRGAVRAVLAANRLDRLFSNRGAYSGSDVDAIARRLTVIDASDRHRAALAGAAARALGRHDANDPVRLARVAGHFAWIQSRGDLDYPVPAAAAVERELRAGSDIAQGALLALEQARLDATPWLAVDPDGERLHVEVGTWARVAAVAPQAITRAVAAYVLASAVLLRSHPVTGAPLDTRARWAILDLKRLQHDGFEIGT